jgi:hypothetical protein
LAAYLTRYAGTALIGNREWAIGNGRHIARSAIEMANRVLGIGNSHQQSGNGPMTPSVDCRLAIDSRLSI